MAKVFQRKSSRAEKCVVQKWAAKIGGKKKKKNLKQRASGWDTVQPAGETMLPQLACWPDADWLEAHSVGWLPLLLHNWKDKLDISVFLRLISPSSGRHK